MSRRITVKYAYSAYPFPTPKKRDADISRRWNCQWLASVNGILSQGAMLNRMRSVGGGRNV